MVLPRPFGADEDQIAGFGEEVEGEGTLDEGSVDFLGPVPVEVGHGFETAQAGLGEAAFQAAAGLVRRFAAGDFFQQLAGGPALGGGAGQQVVEALSGEEQAYLLELCDQVRAAEKD